MTDWNITVKIDRYKPGEQPHTDTFQIAINPERTALDAVEIVWAKHDRTLTFRHACHHASCGSCAFIVNGVEVLPCIVMVKDLISDGGTLHVKPLSNFPLVSDLVTDMEPFFSKMLLTGMPIVGPCDVAKPWCEPTDAREFNFYNEFHSFENCIECGMCMSACPVVGTNPDYMGPAILAAAYRVYQNGDKEARNRIMDLVDSENGIWRCHVAYECTEVCPSNVDPAGKIMELRRRATIDRVRRLFGMDRK